MNQLTELQQELITYLQKGLEGKRLDKPTMDVFCCCNQSAIEKVKTNNNNKNNINFNYSTNTNSTVDYTDREKERNNNNTLNSTTDMLMFTERLELLSKEIEAFKDEINTLNERVNNASKMIKELKESVNTIHNLTDSTNGVNLNYFEIWNLKKEFSDQFKIAKNPNVATSERLKAAKIMNSISYRYPDILTKKQRKAAMALLYVNDNTNVESKSETKAEVRKEMVLELYNPLKSIEENLKNIASKGIKISKRTLMYYVKGNGSREAKTRQIEALIDTTVSMRENYRRLKKKGMKVGINKVSEIYNKIKNI